jgi:hypothetical protein
MRTYVTGRRGSVEHAGWFGRQVQIGLDSANAGRPIPVDEVEADAEAWREATRRRLASRA